MRKSSSPLLRIRVAELISVNAAYIPVIRGKHASIVLSQPARNLKQRAAMDARSAMNASGWDAGPGPFGLRLFVSFPTMKRHDLDNVVKMLQDGLAEGLFIDDSQIVDVHVTRCLNQPRKKAYAIAVVERLSLWRMPYILTTPEDAATAYIDEVLALYQERNPAA